MDYAGPERRRHRVYLTRNTEYHLRDQVCIAVRDRGSGRWLQRHFAVRRPVRGAIRFFTDGGLTASGDLPRVGESMYFEDQGRDLVTSAVIAVERPARDIVCAY